jgi:hypothetical protein
MQLLLSTCVAALLILQTSAQLRSPPKQDGQSLERLVQHRRSLSTLPIPLGDCADFALMAGSTATCAGASDCTMANGVSTNGGFLGVSPGTSHTGNFAPVANQKSTADSAACAAAGLNALNIGKAKAGTVIAAEMGGITFGPGVYTHGTALNIGLANPNVYLDAGGNTDAVFIFVAGSTLTTCAGSEIVLLGGAKAENVFWVLGTALTMGADSTFVGNVLAGSAITIGTNGKICGRAIAQTAVTCATACTVDIDCSASEAVAAAAAIAAAAADATALADANAAADADAAAYDTAAAAATAAADANAEQCLLNPECMVMSVDPEVLPADLGGKILPPGTYHSAAAVGLTGVLTLQGGTDSVWTFIIGAAFSTAAASQIVFAAGSGGTVRWEVTGAISTGANSHAIGTMISKGAITLGAGAHSHGALEADGAITLGANARALSATTTAATTLGAGATLVEIPQLPLGTVPAELGDLILGPGTYKTTAAATLTGNLILDGSEAGTGTGSGPDWIFEINGAFSTGAGSVISKRNAGVGTVTFIVNGAITTGANSVAIGTLKAAPGAITTGASSRAETLVATGAITTGASSIAGALTAVGAITLGANAHADSANTGAATTKGAGASLGTDPVTPTVTTLVGQLGGVTLTAPGTYTAAAAVGLTGVLTLQGAGDWHFHIVGALTTAAASQIVRTGHVAGTDKVYWHVGGAITTGAASTSIGKMEAVGAITTGAGAHTGELISSQAAITLGAGAQAHGMLTAAAAITLGAGATIEGVVSSGGLVTMGAGATTVANFYDDAYN